MELNKTAVAGTLESSDVMVTVIPNPGEGIDIDLESSVKKLFGESIEQTIREVLAEFGIEDAKVIAVDKGALDCTIRARVQCAVCRAAQIPYEWGKEDRHVG